MFEPATGITAHFRGVVLDAPDLAQKARGFPAGLAAQPNSSIAQRRPASTAVPLAPGSARSDPAPRTARRRTKSLLRTLLLRNFRVGDLRSAEGLRAAHDLFRDDV